MPIANPYYYIFYKLYKSFENAPLKWLSDWKASFGLLVLEIWVLLSGMVYFKVITKKDLFCDAGLPIASFIVIVVLVMIKYFSFEYQNRWKAVIEKFDKWPKRKNMVGTIIVWSIVLIILSNLIFSFYLLSQIDWKMYHEVKTVGIG